MLLFCTRTHAFELQVIANMNAAYKDEKKKSAKRKTHIASSMSFKTSDPPFGTGDSPPQKKQRDSLYLSFPEETVLATERCSAGGTKAELAYDLAGADVP